jgi:hypothetical protein
MLGFWVKKSRFWVQQDMNGLLPLLLQSCTESLEEARLMLSGARGEKWDFHEDQAVSKETGLGTHILRHGLKHFPLHLDPQPAVYGTTHDGIYGLQISQVRSDCVLLPEPVSTWTDKPRSCRWRYRGTRSDG